MMEDSNTRKYIEGILSFTIEELGVRNAHSPSDIGQNSSLSTNMVSMVNVVSMFKVPYVENQYTMMLASILGILDHLL